MLSLSIQYSGCDFKIIVKAEKKGNSLQGLYISFNVFIFLFHPNDRHAGSERLIWKLIMLNRNYKGLYLNGTEL